MNWIPYGPNAWLFRFAEKLGDEAFQRGRAIVAELEKNPPAGLVEFVPSFTTVLLEFSPDAVREPSRELEKLGDRLRSAMRHPPADSAIREIPVIYDGPDLGRVAEINRLNVREVGELHSGTIYKVYVIGFAPGFPYLGDLDQRLHTPRLGEPRPGVPAGSVAIGGEHTGIYPVASPGGWNLIGRTSVRLFDPVRRTPRSGDRAMFWLKAGDRVRFVPVRALPDPA